MEKKWINGKNRKIEDDKTVGMTLTIIRNYFNCKWTECSNKNPG